MCKAGEIVQGLEALVGLPNEKPHGTLQLPV